MRFGTVLAVVTVMAAPSAARAQEQVVPQARRLGNELDDHADGGCLVFRGVDDRRRRRLPATARRRPRACRAALDSMPDRPPWSGTSRSKPAIRRAPKRSWPGSGPAVRPRVPAPARSSAEVRSGIAAAPGCARFRPDAFPAVHGQQLQLHLFHRCLRHGRKRQCPRSFPRAYGSPCSARSARLPTIPTFSDVPPSHPYYRFIEALADAADQRRLRQPPFLPGPPVDPRRGWRSFFSEALGLNFPD